MDFNTFKPLQDFDDFRSKVTQSAMAAAEVVQKLNDLDEMAEDDEYLKTESLNVKEMPRPVRNDSTKVDTESQTPAQPPPAPPDEGGTTTAPLFSPEERAQQLVAQALFQTPLSSAQFSQTSSSSSRRDSPSTSLADYASAAEEECPEDPLLSKGSEAKNWSLLDSVLSTDPTPSGPGKQEDESTLPLAPDPEQQRSNNMGIGRNMNQEMNKEATAKKEQNKPYMLSVVAALMDDTDGGKKVTESSVERVGASAGCRTDSFDARIGAENKAGVDTNHEPDAFEQNRSLESAGLHYDSDSSSDDSGDWSSSKRRSDPILTLMQKEKEAKSEMPSPQPGRGGGAPIENDMVQEEASMSTKKDVNKKDPNRFFSDLDRRLATGDGQLGETHDEEAGPPKLDRDHDARQPLEQESFAEATDKFQWLRNVAAPRVFDSVSKNLKLMQVRGESSLAVPSARSRNQQLNGAKGTTQDEFNVVVSSSLLAAEEHAELERLKQSTKQNLFTTLAGIVNSNPRFAFIAFTLLLSSFVYFYARKRTEDDVTR